VHDVDLTVRDVGDDVEAEGSIEGLQTASAKKRAVITWVKAVVMWDIDVNVDADVAVNVAAEECITDPLKAMAKYRGSITHKGSVGEASIAECDERVVGTMHGAWY
jgi:hypothetical protein